MKRRSGGGVGLLLFLILGAACGPAAPTPSAPPTPTPLPPEVRAYAFLGRCALLLEVAETPEALVRGLMYRPHLPSVRGMLFILERDGPLVFWMKGTLFPLDILFLDKEGRIVDLQTMVPEPGVPPERLTRYVSRAPAQYAIEMNAGLARDHGLKVCDRVEWRRGPPPVGVRLC